MGEEVCASAGAISSWSSSAPVSSVSGACVPLESRLVATEEVDLREDLSLMRRISSASSSEMTLMLLTLLWQVTPKCLSAYRIISGLKEMGMN